MPATLDKEYDLEGEAFDPVVDLIRKSVPCAVLDVPHVWTTWAKSILSGADEIVITAMPDLANLRNATNMVDLLITMRPNDSKPHLVLNQTGVPKKPEIAAKEFGSALGLEPSAIIAYGPQIFATAANNGQMIAEMQANAKPVEAFRELSQALMGRTENKEGQEVAAGAADRALQARQELTPIYGSSQCSANVEPMDPSQARRSSPRWCPSLSRRRAPRASRMPQLQSRRRLHRLRPNRK